MTIVIILSTVIYLCIILKLGNKVYNSIRTSNLMLAHIGCEGELFHDNVILFTVATPFSF